MNLELSKLPDNASVLKKIIALHLTQEEKYQERIDYLEQMVSLLQKQLFGRKSEKNVLPDHNQLQLFGSVESPEFDRQQKIFARLGIDLSRATMANGVVNASQQCQPLIDLLEKEIRGGPLIHIDETPYQVLNEPGRPNTSKSYMWVFKGGPENRPALLYQYHRTRGGEEALKFLEDYQGYIQSDAFSGYEFLSGKKGITHVGCWAHARRYFGDVIKAKKKNRSKRGQPKSLADEALEFIVRLYLIEKEAKARNLDAQGIYQLRQEKSKAVIENS